MAVYVLKNYPLFFAEVLGTALHRDGVNSGLSLDMKGRREFERLICVLQMTQK